MGTCVFCGIVAGDAPAQVIYEDEATMCFMDINPATAGHCLVVPKRHSRDVFDLPEEDGVAVWRTVQKVSAAARATLDPDGLNLLAANGAAAFQTIFHFHVHVIPRYAGDDIRLPWIPRTGDPDAIAEAADRLRSALPRGPPRFSPRGAG